MSTLGARTTYWPIEKGLNETLSQNVDCIINGTQRKMKTDEQNTRLD